VKKLLLVFIVATAFTGSPVHAADMAVKAPAPAISNWSGFYVGVNAGDEWGTSDPSTSIAAPGPFFGPGCFPPLSNCVVNTIDVQNAGAQKTHTHGFTGGAQAGYNLQSGSIVYGVEADFQSFRAIGSSTKTVNDVSGNGTVTVGSSISTEWLFTLRPRAGVVVNNNWLFYVTGGLAVSKLNSSWTYADTTFGDANAGSFSKVETGWTAGAGVEAMLPQNWIIGAEYLFVDLGNVSATIPTVISTDTAPDFINHSADLKSNIVRLRLSKHF
jgi:outer membrane immunogenic protein